MYECEISNKVPHYYLKGPRNLQVLHRRLRTESSCLNALLIAKHSVDSPTRRCGLVEDNTHYLFQCQLFLTAQTVLLDSIVPLQCTTQLLLYGHSDLTIETNNLLF